MKNIHLIPTDKPSRLCFVICTEKSTLTLFEDEMYKGKRFFPHNIYITSAKKIKDGDWFYDLDGALCKYTSDYKVDPNSWDDNKKVILTTDQDLIKDGVQDIDDEFLEWFVNNPSCEKVPIITTTVNNKSLYKTNIGFESWRKEEPKQELRKVCKCKRAYENPLSEICSLCWNELFPNEKDEIKNEDLLKPKQETLEEEVECNNCGNIMSLLEDESIYACYNSECTSCYEEYNQESAQLGIGAVIAVNFYKNE
jgi:hypothetical protein